MTTQPQATPPPQIVYVTFAAEIVRHTAENLMDTVTKLANWGVPEVYMLLTTPGGDVSLGMAIYHHLRAQPFKLTTHNIGTVASIGNAVFLAGEERYASPQATFMFHGVFFETGGGKLDEKYLREQLGAIDAEHQRIGAVIAQRTTLTQDAINELFRDAQTKDAPYAASVGIVNAVQDVTIPAGVTQHTIINTP